MSSNANRKRNDGAANTVKTTTTVIKQKAKGGASSQGKKKKSRNNDFVATRDFVSAVPRTPHMPQRAMEMVCGLTDPFCKAAKGARWPDGLGQDAMTGQVRGHQSLVTYGNGTQLGFYTPSISYNNMLASAANPFAMPAALSATPGGQAVTAYSSTYRIVSAGIIIRNIASAFTTAGFIIVTRHPKLPAFSANIIAGSVYGTTASTHSLHAGMEVPLIFKEIGTNSRTFQNANTTTVQPDNGWDVIGIEIVGAPVSLVMLDIELVVNVEFTLTETNIGLSQLTTNISPDEPQLARAANQVSTELSTMAWNGLDQFGAAAIRAIKSKLGTKMASLAMVL